MCIVIGADIVPTESNYELFAKGESAKLVGEELSDLLTKSEYKIFNLEVPLTNIKNPIIKQGPNLVAPTATVNGYKDLGVNLLALANNHILDQGFQGLKETIDTLDQAGINHVGAGSDYTEASTPFIFKFATKKIGVYACAEHEFSIAGSLTPGANPFDPLFSLDHIVDLKEKCDYVIVLYHGGKEHYRYPSPMLQKNCRRLVDKGADLVICQHSHCIGCEEKYKGGTIVYGQGNFLFDHSVNECWRTGLLIKVNDDFKISYIPLIKTRYGVKLADEQEGMEIMDGFKLRSDEIKEAGAVEEKYKVFANSHLDFYLNRLSGKKTIMFRIANRLSKGALRKWYFHCIYKKQNKVSIINCIECEAHNELLLQALKNAIF